MNFDSKSFALGGAMALIGVGIGHLSVAIFNSIKLNKETKKLKTEASVVERVVEATMPIN